MIAIRFYQYWHTCGAYSDGHPIRLYSKCEILDEIGNLIETKSSPKVPLEHPCTCLEGAAEPNARAKAAAMQLDYLISQARKAKKKGKISRSTQTDIVIGAGE